MRRSFCIFLIIFSQSILGQENSHGQIENGCKVGDWPEFYSSGKIKLNKVYGKPTSLRVTEKTVAFQLGLTIDSVIDTIIYYDNLLYTDYSEYDENWNLIRNRRAYYRGETVYVYGDENEIGIKDNWIKNIVGRVSKKTEVPFPLMNFSQNNLKVTPNNPYENINIQPSTFIIMSGDTSIITVIIDMSSGDQEYDISFNTESADVDVKMSLYGYHIRSEDFNQSKSIRVKEDVLNYYRTGNEGLLNIYNVSKSSILQTESLAFVKTEIKLNELKSGSYWLEIIDYSEGQKKWLRIEKVASPNKQ